MINDCLYEAIVGWIQQLDWIFQNLLFVLTNASHDGLGAVLSQLDKENHERVILYASTVDPRFLHPS